jgi:arylsulfatase A-like enzyme
MHEPSLRTPTMIRYPRLFHAGTKVDEMVLNLDFAPTLLELAGVAIPEAMQGKSLVKLALGKEGQWRQDWLYEYFEYPGAEQVHPHRGVRTTRYKYIHYYLAPDEFELYDLQADPGERINLIGSLQYSAIQKQLADRLEQLRNETDDRTRNAVS